MSQQKWHQPQGVPPPDIEPRHLDFDTDYDAIVAKIDAIDPIKYAQTRNHTRGAVTYLSPYISRGVISTRQVLQALLAKGYQRHQMAKLVSELAWRDYFQQVHRHLGPRLFADIKQPQPRLAHHNMLAALATAQTGIHAIDDHINLLITNGYMHNHVRMYFAALACNFGKAHWAAPAAWLYYHLLDGDLASNICSWQWVAGSFSSKLYYCNQQNINTFTGSQQQGTFLDADYEYLQQMAVPEVLQATVKLELHTALPEVAPLQLDPNLPLLLYNSNNLDPLWRANETGNRVLVLEPSHFEAYPISQKVLQFVLALTQNIPKLQIFVGEVGEIPQLSEFTQVYHKEHPLCTHYPGMADARDWLVPEVSGYFPSFFAYFKRIEQLLPRG